MIQSTFRIPCEIAWGPNGYETNVTPIIDKITKAGYRWYHSMTVIGDHHDLYFEYIIEFENKEDETMFRLKYGYIITE